MELEVLFLDAVWGLPFLLIGVTIGFVVGWLIAKRDEPKRDAKGRYIKRDQP